MTMTSSTQAPPAARLAVAPEASHTRSDREILDLFAASGLNVEFVDYCSDAGCQWCAATDVAA